MIPALAEEAGRSILAHAIDAFDQTGAVAAPDRRYLSHNRPPHDCEQLVVWLARLGQKQPTNTRNTGCTFIHQATFGIEIVRCHPVLEDTEGRPVLPTQEALDDAGGAFTTDGWTLWQYLIARHLDGSLIPDASCKDTTFGEAVPYGPQGGFASWVLTLSVTLTPNAASAAS